MTGPNPSAPASQEAKQGLDGALVAGGGLVTAAPPGSPDDAREEGGYETSTIRLPERQRRLRRIVIGAVSACVLILVAAGISRVGRASDDGSRAGRASTASEATPVAAAPASPEVTAPPTPAAATDAPAALSAPTKGTLRIDANLKPRSVLLDGRKLTARSEVVTCGAHQLKVGRAHARAIDVPCGGELRVSR